MPVFKDVPVRYLAVATAPGEGLAGDEQFNETLTDFAVRHQLYPLPLPVVPAGLEIATPWFQASSRDGTFGLALQERIIEFRFSGPPALERNVALPTRDAFVDRAAATLAEVLRMGGMAASRMGLVFEEMATNRPARACHPNEVGRRLLQMPQDREGRQLTEWRWRFGARIDDGPELFNTIANLAGVTGSLAGEAFAAVGFNLDANTPQEDARARFLPEQIGPLLGRLLRLNTDLEAEIDVLVGEY